MPNLRPRVTAGQRGRPDPGRSLRTAADAKPKLVVPQPLTRQQVATAAGPAPVAASPRRYSGTTTDPGDIVLPTIQPGTGTQAITPPTDPTLLGGDATLDQLSAQFLEESLAAIEAQFGLTREQLMRSQTAIGQEYQLLSAQLEQARGVAQEQAQFGAQERGILRSGIAAEAQADVEREFAGQGDLLEQSRATQTESILAQLAGLDQQQQIAELEARRQAELRALNQQVLDALADAGV